MNSKSLIRARGDENTILARSLETADDFLSRSIGLLGKKSFATGEGLWIKRCNSIHTLFMSFSIDAIFVDQKLNIVSMYQTLKPWRITRLHFKASSVFELPAGTIKTLSDAGKALSIGDRLTIDHVKTTGGKNG